VAMRAGVFLGSLFGGPRPPLQMKMGFHSYIFSRRIFTVGSYHELLVKYLPSVKTIYTNGSIIMRL